MIPPRKIARARAQPRTNSEAIAQPINFVPNFVPDSANPTATNLIYLVEIWLT
jgi:hypothetical protein